MKRVSKSTIINKIRKSGGRFFSVLFRKRNGDLRLMNCKINKDRIDEAIKAGRIPVVENEVGFRNINISGIVWVNVDKENLRVK